ncbi:uncharacterized protein BJX67DRAFT_89825 [Aspergillus lucknowensis]|uniref:Uncharacterized protein n=1 Tax=Aspergillus lucknowensis TaxID=176173 RepID=A0ABR4M5H4_9EURO
MELKVLSILGSSKGLRKVSRMASHFHCPWHLETCNLNCRPRISSEEWSGDDAGTRVTWIKNHADGTSCFDTYPHVSRISHPCMDLPPAIQSWGTQLSLPVMVGATLPPLLETQTRGLSAACGRLAPRPSKAGSLTRHTCNAMGVEIHARGLVLRNPQIPPKLQSRAMIEIKLVSSQWWDVVLSIRQLGSSAIYNFNVWLDDSSRCSPRLHCFDFSKTKSERRKLSEEEDFHL